MRTFFLSQLHSTRESEKKKKNGTDDLEDSKKSYDDCKILNGEHYFVVRKDNLTNTTEDLIDSNMSILLYQDVHDNRCSYSTTTTNGEFISILISLFRLMNRVQDNTIAIIMQLVVLYQVKYEDRLLLMLPQVQVMNQLLLLLYQ